MYDRPRQEAKIQSKTPEELTDLKNLHLRGTQVSDVSALTALTKLERLDLYQTKVSPEQVEALQKALPQLRIEGP